MTKYSLSLLFIICLTVGVNGQQLRIQMGGNISFFDYKNSKGESLATLESSPNASATISYRTMNPMKRFHFSAGLAYNRYSARGSNPLLNNYFDWQADYLGLDLVADLEIFRTSFYYGIHKKNLTLILKTVISPEFLLQGTQTINQEVINLRGIEQFDKPFLFARGGIALNYYLSKNIGITFEYLGGRSLFTIGKNIDPDEILRFNVHSLEFGLAIRLPE
ncbi:MAG: hypothetical protein U9N85_13505 [Bacteroidota bacterium]|nr:hypothetical protein [Bacteroidota bacterium]